MVYHKVKARKPRFIEPRCNLTAVITAIEIRLIRRCKTMANTISIQFNNQITSIQELRDYLTKRIAHIRSRDGKLTRIEEECQTILDMLPEEE